jgi:hypothetical protein
MAVQELLQAVQAITIGYSQAEERYAARLAPGFSSFLFIPSRETTLSKILACLLDPKGAHGQGALFLRGFLDLLDGEWKTMDCRGAEVRTEESVEEGRLDVRIQMGGLAVVIENKPWAGDQDRQLERYIGRADTAALVYLTSDGREPSPKSISNEKLQEHRQKGRIHLWSYRHHVLEWLSQCRCACKADRVSAFVAEFEDYIRQEFNGERNTTMRDAVVDEVTKSGEAVDAAMQIVFAAEDIRRRLFARLRDDIATQTEAERWEEIDLSDNDTNGRDFSLWIIFSYNCRYHFCLAFRKPRCAELIYGLHQDDPSQNPGPAIEILKKELGEGESNNPYWIWYRDADSTELSPTAERNWGSSATPWKEIADGSMARRIVQAARKFAGALRATGLLTERMQGS